MIHFCESDPKEKIGVEMYFNDNQSWNEKDLKQLRNKYNIFFMSDGKDDCVPVKIIDNKFFAIGSEDDGCLYFDTCFGKYLHIFSIGWIPSLINNLKTAYNKFTGGK